MKNATAHKLAQTIIFILCLVWASMLMTSCSTSGKVTHHHQQHLKSKRTGAHQLHNGNGGCNWNK
jgi:hypothetical protein